MSAATIKMHHSILSSALDQAVKWDLVSRAATDNATPPRLTRFRASQKLQDAEISEWEEITRGTDFAA